MLYNLGVNVIQWYMVSSEIERAMPAGGAGGTRSLHGENNGDKA